MQYFSWQPDIALIRLSSCGKLVIMACKFTVKLHSSESKTSPAVAGKNPRTVYECFDSEHGNI